MLSFRTVRKKVSQHPSWDMLIKAFFNVFSLISDRLCSRDDICRIGLQDINKTQQLLGVIELRTSGFKPFTSS